MDHYLKHASPSLKLYCDTRFLKSVLHEKQTNGNFTVKTEPNVGDILKILNSLNSLFIHINCS